MAYNWTNTITVGSLVKWNMIQEINTVNDYVVSAHCPSNYTSNRTSHNTTVNSHNTSVWSDNSYDSDNSYSSGYEGYWSSENLGGRS